MEEKKRRGRPPLSPEEKALRLKEKNKRDIERQKNNGYAAQKKYRLAHPDNVVKWRQRFYEPKIRIPKELRPILNSLIKDTGLTITQLFVSAVEEKYGVTLHDILDN